jgi:hypothetical protein
MSGSNSMSGTDRRAYCDAFGSRATLIAPDESLLRNVEGVVMRWALTPMRLLEVAGRRSCAGDFDAAATEDLIAMLLAGNQSA